MLAVAGVAVFVVFQISHTDPDFRMILPGSQEIDLDTGNYTLFYEHTTQFNGQAFSTDSVVPAIRFFVIGPDETGIELETPSSNKGYEFDGRAGYSVVTFKVENPGLHTVGGGYPDGPTVSIFIFALGKSASGSFLIAILSLLGGLGMAFFVAITTFATRRAAVPR